MYRILITDKDNKNIFYMENDEIFEAIAPIAEAKYVELLDLYPMSRLNIIENSIEEVGLDIEDTPTNLFLQYNMTIQNVPLTIYIGQETPHDLKQVFIQNNSSTTAILFEFSWGNIQVSPEQVVATVSDDNTFDSEENILSTVTSISVASEYSEDDITTHLQNLLI